MRLIYNTNIWGYFWIKVFRKFLIINQKLQNSFFSFNIRRIINQVLFLKNNLEIICDSLFDLKFRQRFGDLHSRHHSIFFKKNPIKNFYHVKGTDMSVMYSSIDFLKKKKKKQKSSIRNAARQVNWTNNETRSRNKIQSTTIIRLPRPSILSSSIYKQTRHQHSFRINRSSFQRNSAFIEYN